MQGKNMIESGDAAGAVTTLQKVSDIDSHPDGLRDLLKAYLQAGQLSEAGTVANKLLTVHNDLPAISSFADALMQAGQYETALQVFDQHAERLLAENSDKVLDSLHTIIGHVRDNPDSLQKLLDLFHKAGENTHVSEVIELLAHASVQSGDLPRARDLYQKLATVEPQNALHMQNYQQVVGQLGGTSGSKLITPDEAVVLIDDLEATAPSIHQHYTDEIALAVRSALTDAELFISYNMPAKALGPLVGALPLAPDDLRVNQRLAALHTRAGRFAEAALCCRTLQSVYSEAEHPEEATRYGELATRYEERSSISAPVASPEDEPIFLDAPAPAQPKPGQTKQVQTKPVQAKRAAPLPVEEPESDVPEFSVEEVPTHDAASEEEAAPVAQAASPWPTATEPEFAVVDESSTNSEEPASPGEIDLSSEWDDSITVEDDVPAAPAAEVEVASAAGDDEVQDQEPSEDTSKADETIEEIRFYLGHGMPAQAMAALAKLQTLTGDVAKIAELRTEVEAANQAAAEPEIEELTSDDIPSLEVTVDETPVEEAPAVEEPAAVEPEPAVEEIAVEAEVESEPEPVAHVPAPVVPAPVVQAPVFHAPVVRAPVVRAPAVRTPVVQAPVVHAPVPAPAPAPNALNEFVSDLDASLGDTFQPGAVAHPAAPPVASTATAKPPQAPTPPAKPAVAAAATSAPVLGEFVADIEASLGEDFMKSAPVAQAVPAPPVPAPVAPRAIPPMAASAAASASPTNQVASAAPATAPAPMASVAWRAPVADVPRPLPPAAPAAAAAKASPFGDDAGVDLAEMFGELKKDLDADLASADEDPETHYNLGIAFREMGLLDEAIGELQKACQSFDQGRPFPQIMQTYTWLAQCFLEKGVPEAAIRWYDKALNVPTIDGETRVALHYELASAYETAGDKPSALKHFMDVYGNNIDYRDVSERIKALKS
jgi:tetratricopeptide (TPR) repeat protein